MTTRLEGALSGVALLAVRTSALLALIALPGGCNRAARSTADGGEAATAEGDAQPAVLAPPATAELMFDGGLANGWKDWGWAPREAAAGGAERVRFDNWGGWTLAKPGLKGNYGGVVFRVKMPPGMAEFLQVRVESDGAKFPSVKLSPALRRDVGGGWSEVFVPMSELDPEGLPFERFTFYTFRLTTSEWIYIDHVALTTESTQPRRPKTYDPASLRSVALSVDCVARAIPIRPSIYGINAYAQHPPERQAAQWLLGATARRWGGNTMSTYNWELSVWNTGDDWFYENIETPSYSAFLEASATHDMASAITVPMTGWVAKDKTSFSFPVSAFGPQKKTDTEGRVDAGNGISPADKPIPPGSPARAYVQVTPIFVKRWVQAIRREDAKTGKRSVAMYILDNEPSLWNVKHRDVHPDPLTYDELIERTVAYATAIREADPDALIAGPAEWGWNGYLYSAKDRAAGSTMLRPDRRAHGDMPLVAYYLKTLSDRAAHTGVRLLDVLDLHAYPQAPDVYGDRADAVTAALRIRQTRMLWDETYVDESYIKEPVKLLPRMRQWIDQNYPGRALSIGEWNFGGEEHMSGGLAVAEALGRFGQFGVGWAFYWVYPPASSPAMWAFRAYRDFDGRGGHFLDWSAPATSANADVSLFASRDESGSHMVLVALNLSPEAAVAARMDVSSCGKVASESVYSYTGGPGGFAVEAPPPRADSSLVQALPPYSITVIDLQLADARSLTK